MQKNISKIIAILLSFATIIILFAACSDHENELIYKENGKIYYRKEIGDAAYELVTDKEGNTVVDDNGNMLWKVTDADGNDQTHPVSFPAFLTDGKKIECQQFTIKLPSGWESTGNVNLIVKNQKKNLQIMGSFFGKSDEDYKTPQERATELIEKFAVETEKYTTTVTSSTTQVGGRDAVKVVIDTTGETPSYSEVYYVEIGTGTISFWCSCGNYEEKGFDFKGILDTVEYRI